MADGTAQDYALLTCIENEETVVCTLLHDIGDHLAPANHSEVAAAMLRPDVSEKNYWIVKHHGVFQCFYYFHHVGQDPNARDRWRDHPYYRATVDFCAKLRPELLRPRLFSGPSRVLRADGASRALRGPLIRPDT